MNKFSPNVLIVDDNPLSRSLMGYLLKSLGCFVFEAEDGQQSLEEIKNHKYDLIVLDWKMPKLSGPETLIQSDSILKNRNQGRKQIPVLIYTNTVLSELRIPHCQNLSVKGTISKSLTPFQQMRRVKTSLHHLFSKGA